MTLCRENDWGLAFHQTLPDFLAVYESLGLKKLKIGDDAIVEPEGIHDFGKRGQDFPAYDKENGGGRPPDRAVRTAHHP